MNHTILRVLLVAITLSPTAIFHAIVENRLVAQDADSTTKKIVDKRAILTAENFWDNRDWEWYLANIPFIECPDKDIQTTYYYRWEVVTKHLTYGSPRSGYSYTEFIDRPFWSGRYGSISCPAGHQLYEVRWLRDPRYSSDYCRYWFRTSGAQPRNYSTWLADGVYATLLLHPDRQYYLNLLPDLKKNWEGWKQSHFDDPAGLFWQTGHDDGMEFNINSRQTQDILRGAPAYRPTLNSYMWADAIAIAKFAEMSGDSATANDYRSRAAAIKERLQRDLWDPQRNYFFPKSRRDEELDGHKVKAGSLTYQTGKFAGNAHGRELIGLVPWQFNLPDPGYEAAWKFLMDPKYFFAAYGPTVTEREDPLFLVTNHCCWWSGQSWPYATSQTLTAMANLLHNYQQNVVTRDDYLLLLQTYTRTHQKNGQPYIAEAANPDTGSWEGYDNYNHSEHYFHSSYCDLILSGLAGIKPISLTADAQGKDVVRTKIDPLFPATWEYFAVVDAPLAGHRLSLLWDKTGQKYNHKAGLTILIDDQVVAHRPDLGALEVDVPVLESKQLTTAAANDYRPSRANWLANNDGTFFPKVTATASAAGTSLTKIQDGNIFYHRAPPNRWISDTLSTDACIIEADFGITRTIDEFKLYFLEDDNEIVPPKGYRYQYWRDGQWSDVVLKNQSPELPTGRCSNRTEIESITTQKIRLLVDCPAGKPFGLSEWEAWGPVQAETLLDNQAIPLPGNLALNAKGEGFPKVTASFTSPYDKVLMANDGLVSFQPQPHNRWTTYLSKESEDWLELRWEQQQVIERVELAIYDDGGGVQRPTSIRLEVLKGDQWEKVPCTAQPKEPAGGIWNVLKLEKTNTSAIRIYFEHRGNARSGISEILVF